MGANYFIDYDRPLVSIIVPTTADRRAFNERIMEIHKAQDYHPNQLVFQMGDKSVGIKRNMACENSFGTIIEHMDSDDLYKPDWTSRSVDALIKNKAEIVGLSKFNLYDPEKDAFYQYTYPQGGAPWVAGGTMMYYRSFWEQNTFPDKNIGEDVLFVLGNANKAPVVYAHDYVDGFLCIIHPGNTSKKLIDNASYRRLSEGEETALKESWNL